MRLLRDLAAMAAYALGSVFTRIGVACEQPQVAAEEEEDLADQTDVYVALFQNGHREAKVTRTKENL